MPRGGKREGTGRPKGALGKATIERLEKAKLDVREAKASGKKLGKDVLEEFMYLFAGMAAAYQPLPPGAVVPVGRAPNEDKFKEYAVLARDTAFMLAKYQSPTFKAIPVTVQPDSPQPQFGDGDPTNVVTLDDPEALVRVYKRRISQVG